MNVHLLKWDRVGFCMQTCSFSALRTRWGPRAARSSASPSAGGFPQGTGPPGGAAGRLLAERRAGPQLCSRSEGATPGRERPQGRERPRGRARRAPCRTVPPSGCLSRREGGRDGCLPACLPALCLDSNSTLTRKRITCYLTCKLLRKKHLPSNLTKLGMPGKNEIYLNEETRCKLAVSQTAIDSCIDLSSNVSSQ